jgi:hypothetical protein
VFGPALHRLPYELDTVTDRQRRHISLHHRCHVPQEFHLDRQDHPEAAVSRVRAHLPRTLQPGHSAARGAAPKHLLQALYLLCARVRSGREKRARAAPGAHRQTHRQRQRERKFIAAYLLIS